MSWAAKPAMSTGRDTTSEAAQTLARKRPWLVTKPVRKTGAVSAMVPVSTRAKSSSFQLKMKQIRAAAAVSTPFDLGEGCRYLERGFSRVYQWHFLRTLRRKAREKAARFPGQIRMKEVEAARTLWEFDDAVTAPVHGFASAADYYARSSSLGFLPAIRVPTLLLSAADDPFLPARVLDRVRQVAAENARLVLEFSPHGGHVGFVSGSFPWAAAYHAEARAVDFLLAAADRRVDDPAAVR